MKRFFARAYFDRHDLWIGAYWRLGDEVFRLPPALRSLGRDKTFRCLTIYICPLPCCVVQVRKLIGGEVVDAGRV